MARRGPQRHWLATLHDTAGWNTNEPIPFDTDGVRYAVWQLERGSETDTLHVQLYIEYDRNHRLRWVKQHLGGAGVHAEPRGGTRDQARDYCRKEDTRSAGPWEFGLWTLHQGRRTDLEALQNRCRDGATLLTLYQEHFSNMVRYGRGVEKYLLLLRANRDGNHACRVLWLWGPTGSGKSRLAYRLGAQAFWVNSTSTGVWWDGYQGQLLVVMDDLRGNWMPMQVLLRIMDRYPYSVQTKGSMRTLNATRFIVTSCFHPTDLYRNSREDPAQLVRRCTMIQHMDVGMDGDGVSGW